MVTKGNGPSLRIVTTAMMAFVGVAAFTALSVEDLAGLTADERANLSAGLIARYVIAMAIGGALAGWLFASLFGRRGVLGWVLALLGGLFATMIAGLFGSAFAMLPDLVANGFSMGDLIGIGFGLAVLPLGIASQLFLAAGWLALVIIAQIWARRIRMVRREA